MTSEARKQTITLRAKKLGVLLRDARLAAGKSLKECGAAIGVSSASMGSYERGAKAPSLPELELLAYYLRISLERFWTEDIKSDDPSPISNIHVEHRLSLRNRGVGAIIKQVRTERNLTVQELAKMTGISTGRLKRYESGDAALPLPELEMVAYVLDMNILQFADHQGAIGKWIMEQRSVQDFLLLPLELQEFVSKPMNQPYIEVAQRLSQMSVDQLRAVAEGLLEITL